MANSPQSQDFDDRRQAPRVEIDAQYTMQLDPCDGRGPIECVILDYSVTGARLELPGDMALPTDVQIRIGQLSHNARIVWRKDRVIGVDFVDEHHDLNY